MILFFSFDSLNVSAPNLLQMIIRVWKLIDTNHWMNFWLNEITTKNEKKNHSFTCRLSTKYVVNWNSFCVVCYWFFHTHKKIQQEKEIDCNFHNFKNSQSYNLKRFIDFFDVWRTVSNVKVPSELRFQRVIELKKKIIEEDVAWVAKRWKVLINLKMRFLLPRTMSIDIFAKSLINKNDDENVLLVYEDYEERKNLITMIF